MIKHKVILVLFFISILSLELELKADNTLTKLDSLIIDLKSKIKDYPNKSDYTFAFLNIKLSDLYIRRDLQDTAFLIIERGLQSCKNIDTDKKVLFLSEKGNYFKNIGQDNKAIACFHDADVLINGVTEISAKINHAINKAEFYRKLGKFRLAITELKFAHTLINKSNNCDPTILIKYFNRFAAVTNESGGDSTVEYSLKAIQLSRLLKDGFSEAISLNELGFYYKNRKMTDTSMSCYLLAEKKWKEYGSYSNAIHTMFNRAQLISHNNLPRQKSTEILMEAIKIYYSKHIEYPIENVYDLLRDNYYYSGDSANYYRYSIIALKTRMYANVDRHEADIRKITEKFKNDSIKAEVNLVSSKLKATNRELNERNSENKRVYLFLIVLVILILIIVFLLYRIYVSNKILKEKFKEKEALVQEIHHRVKNNLQFVNSIINMQSNSLENNMEITVLSETARRIRSMALVHEMLYNKNNESGINMKLYLGELVKNIDDLVNTSRKKIEFLLDIEDITFDVSKATAIGMIVSELASNSLKHAFESTEHPAIKIELKNRNSLNYELIYTDNGVGLPEKYNKSNKIGMRLIDIFSRQTKGTYIFENQNGLIYKINF